MLSKIIKGIKSPYRAYRAVRSRAFGHFYKFWYGIRGKATIGKNFRVNGWLSIKGPGHVIIGDNVVVGMTVTPWTEKPNSTIKIGDNTFLNGTRFACEETIVIGDNVILADCRIMDTDYHGIDPYNRHQHKSAPIYIHDNVWITIACVVLKGVTIGWGATITPNSVVNEDVPQESIYGGNPGRVLGQNINWQKRKIQGGY